MKVNIGPYRSDLIPVHSWERRYEWMRSDNYYHDEKDWKWFDKAIYKILDGLAFIFRPINRWSNNRDRKVQIHIDGYDVWSADNTLAMIIHPTLVKLKEVQHGYPHVDNEDVPENLHMTNEQKEALNWDGTVDANHEARWNYVLDEMIWAFAQCADSDKGHDQFHHNVDQLEMVSTPLEDKPGFSSISFNHQKNPDKPAYWVDQEGKDAHDKRIANGLRLFAKYYFSLWD